MKHLLPYDNKKNKGVMFFSASSVSDTKMLYNFGIKEILVSYFYIRKSKAFYDDFINRLYDEGGLFMTDSGGFSFIGWGSNVEEDQTTAKFWEPYINEYFEWLEKHKTKIFSCANLDLDNQVGREVVDGWNKTMEEFLPYTNVVFVSHKDHTKEYHDKNGLKRFTEYCEKYKYVGINHEMVEDIAKLSLVAKLNSNIVHGFGITSIPTLKCTPLMSVDSTTWLGGVRYGTSYNYDGKNFRVNDHKKKFVRKGDKVLCREFGINHDNLIKEKRNEINRYNLIGWLGARQEYLRAANLKLNTKTVNNYIKLIK